MIHAQSLFAKVRGINLQKHKLRATALVQEKPLLVGVAILFVVMTLNWIALTFGKSERRVLETVQNSSFQGGRILSESGSSYYRGREKQLAKMASDLMERQTAVDAKLKELDQKLMSTQTPQPSIPDAAKTPAQSQPTHASQGGAGATSTDVRLHSSLTTYEPSRPTTAPLGFGGSDLVRLSGTRRGSSLIAFPVKDEKPSDGVVLPSGSFVKAKMLTGVDAPEGKTYPVLLVLDFSYVAPNENRLDLSGCFMIAKAEGDLSTERVQMQASKLSCVSKTGKMFEREVNGFIADNTDASFAMKGKVNTKQGRVAAMAFMSSVVEGVGKAIQQSQTTNSVNPLGGSSSVMTGDAEKYAVAGGAANAASMVAQWYLRQAQSLSSTVSVASGRDVWIVMKDKVELPKEFFRKERSTNAEANIYSYLSRVVD